MSARGHDTSTAPNSLQLEVNLAALLEAMAHAVVIVNSERRIALANGMAESLFDYAKGELIGKPVETLLPERLRTAEASDCFTPTAGGAMGQASELFGVRTDGREFPIEIICRPFQTETGTWSLCAIHNLTERKRIQTELNEKTAALETARQEFQAFSHSISHDLRAPLRAMDGFASMLKRTLGENISKESDHAINRIQENATRMSKLIDGLLDFSALSWIALTKRKFLPGTIAQKSFDALAPSLKDRRVDFSIDDLPECEADMALVRRLFDNLLSNAVKFSRPRDPAVIRIGCRDEDGEQVYFVQDNGVGFDMEYSGKLFHAFQRLHSPSEFEGTGMGLAIAHQIVQRHGGRVWAESAVDRGATFYFILGKSDYGHSA
jgi:PAS domain S-box-containing protein